MFRIPSAPIARRSLPSVTLCVCLLLGSGLPGCRSVPDAPVIDVAEPEVRVMTDEERDRHLASFDRVWSTVNERHYDPTFGGLDWQAIGEEYRPRVAAAASANEVRSVIQEMIGRLELSHFGLIPADAIEAMDEAEADAGRSTSSGAEGNAPTRDSEGAGAESPDPKKTRNRDGKGRPGLDLRILDGRAIITAVEPGGPSDEVGIRPGWEVVRIDGRRVDRTITKLASAYSESSLRDHIMRATTMRRFHGDPGDEVEAVFVREDDTEERRTIRLKNAPGTYARLGQIAEYVYMDSRYIRPGIGYVRFNMFLGPELLQQFSTAIEGYRDDEAAGVILDLRGNPGGVGFFANAMAGWFFEYGEHEAEDLKLGEMFSRDVSRPLVFSILPRNDSYRGKLAVLIDACSASTSEIMAGGLKDLERARVFGSRSAGAALPSTIETLPNGDGFQFAIANYVSRGGGVLEGVGVEPHEIVELSRDSLLEGSDDVVSAAAGWIEQK